MPKSPDQGLAGEEQADWNRGVAQTRIILQAAETPGVVVVVPQPTSLEEEIAFSDFGIIQALPPLLAGKIKYTEGGTGVVLKNGSVIVFSRQADGGHP